jgi:signal transduction histidine kinase/CheY-like chemotaxis protein
MSHLLRKLTIKERLWLIAALILFAFGIMMAVPVNFTSDLFIDDKKELTRVQVETARQIVEHFYQMNESGALSREEAKRLALDALEAAALDDRNYFYVYHANNFIVMHPFLKQQSYPDEPSEILPESRRQFLTSLHDVAGLLGLSGEGRSSVDFIQSTHPDSLTGFFNYQLYVDPSGNAILGSIDDEALPDTAEEKMGYGSYFEPWDWIIFGGVFLDDSNAVYRSLLISLLLPGLLVFSALVVVMFIIGRSITVPLSETVKQIEQIGFAETWNAHLNDTHRDEVGHLSRSFNQMFTHLQNHIEEERRLEERLRHSQKLEAVGQLTGGIAHDFNNLLTVVQGSIELAQTESDPHIRASLLESAQKASERGAMLVEHLLAYSRKQSLMPITTDLNELLEGTRFLLERSIGENINIEFQFHPDLWLCEIDRAQMENSLMNLAINARDAMPSGGDLTIRTDNVHVTEKFSRLNEGDYVTVEISDTGFGIDPGLIDRVFEPFFTTKGPGEGSGLGLSMVYGFVAQSMGDIVISSEPGKGTSITLYIPRSKHREAQTETSDPMHTIDGNGEKFLVLEDEDDLRQITSSMLQGLGYQTLTASNTDEALAIVSSTPDIDLLITDMVLSENRTGVDMATLAALERPELPVLFVSGYSEHPALQQGDIQPDVNFLKKPFSRNALSQIVAKLLRANRQGVGL